MVKLDTGKLVLIITNKRKKRKRKKIGKLEERDIFLYSISARSRRGENKKIIINEGKTNFCRVNS